eukprot:jgi/Psemu1/15801/gm1.15801_g
MAIGGQAFFKIYHCYIAYISKSSSSTKLHIYFRFDDHVINNDIIKEINDFNLQLKYYTDGFRCNTEFFPQYVGICRGEF